jgi:hypothetical protein
MRRLLFVAFCVLLFASAVMAQKIDTIDKDEGVVKYIDFPYVAMSNAREPKLLETEAPARHHRIMFGGTSSTNHRYGHQQRP